MSERRPSTGEIASTAADAAGNMAGVGLGALFAGTEGAVAGAVVGPSLALVLKQAAAQLGGWIGGRQAERVSEAIRVAAADLEQHMAEGGVIREPFAQVDDPERSDAEDIAEGVLQAVAFSYEQKKAQYFGHLLAALAIRRDISIPGDAFYITRLVGNLTYRQLTILAVLTEIPFKQDNVGPAYRHLRQGFADEFEELATYGLIASKGADDEDLRSTFPTVPQREQLRVGDFSPTTYGYLLVEMMRLDTIPGDDRIDVYAHLLAD